MGATTIFIIGVSAAAVLAAVAVFTVAFRRGPGSAPVTGGATGALDKRAIQRDLAARQQQEAAASGGAETAVATLVEDEHEIHVEPAPDPMLDRTELTPEEFGVARRQFFNRAIIGLFGGAFLGGLTISFLAFLWPKLSGGFGSPIAVGSVNDLRREIAQSDGTFAPKFVAAAQAWIVPWTRAEGTAGTSFDSLPSSRATKVGNSRSWRCGRSAYTSVAECPRVSRRRASSARATVPSTTCTGNTRMVRPHGTSTDSQLRSTTGDNSWSGPATSSKPPERR